MTEITTSKRVRKWSREEIDYLCTHVGSMPTKEIAMNLQRSASAVRQHAYLLGLSLASCKGVDPHDKWLCRELFNEGMDIPLIAKKMELSQRTVFNIVYQGQ